MQIRRFQPDDTDALIAIWRDASTLAHAFLTDAFMAQEAENLRTLHFPNADTWVIDEQGRLLGFIALVGDEIGGLFVDPSHQGRGFGRALVDYAASKRDKLKVEVFEKNEIGRRFYTRYGFVESDRYRHEESGETTLRLQLPAR